VSVEALDAKDAIEGAVKEYEITEREQTGG